MQDKSQELIDNINSQLDQMNLEPYVDKFGLQIDHIKIRRLIAALNIPLTKLDNSKNSIMKAHQQNQEDYQINWEG